MLRRSIFLLSLLALLFLPWPGQAQTQTAPAPVVTVIPLASPNTTLPNTNPGILNRQIFNSESTWVQTTQNGVHYLYRTFDGGLLRKMSPNDPTRVTSWTRSWFAALDPGFWAWDARDSRYYYAVSWNDPIQPDKTLLYGTPNSYLYKIDASNGDLATVLLTLPYPTRRKNLQGGVNSSTNMLLVRDVNPPAIATTGGVPAYIPNIYMVDLDTGKLVAQYPINTFGASAPCHDPSTEYHIHDINWLRDEANTFSLNYGPQGDVGEGCEFAIRFDGKASAILYPNTAAGQPYLSHQALSPSGQFVAYGGQPEVGSNIWGAWIRPTWPCPACPPFITVNAGDSSGHATWDRLSVGPYAHDGWINKSLEQWGLTQGDLSGNQSVLYIYPPPRDPANTISLLYGPAQSPNGKIYAVFFPDNWAPASGSPIKAYLVSVQ